MTQGEVVQTARLVITLQPQELNNPSGKPATYECLLRAFDSTHQVWTYFGGYGRACPLDSDSHARPGSDHWHVSSGDVRALTT